MEELGLLEGLGRDKTEESLICYDYLHTSISDPRTIPGAEGVCESSCMTHNTEGPFLTRLSPIRGEGSG